jgi:hypothetical protein
MSKKPSLSCSGSLASCLHFAAKLLSPSTNVAPPAPEALTKDVLAPIVVDAHRFGLQMTKLVSETTGEHNPRKLLHLCRETSDEKVQKTMNGIAVADITWDFQGSVADTLEMELEDLLQRTRAAGHSICALFSISAPEARSAGDHALVWIPEEKDSLAYKHSMLLYVCPGRVKVVKTVGDLVRKMREEIKMIRDSDASYCVWSIIAAPKAGGRRQSQSKEHEGVPSTDALKTSTTIAKVNSPVRSSKDALGEVAGSTQHSTATSRLMPLVSSELASNNDNDADGATSGSRQEKEDGTAPIAKRSSSNKTSIFCFSRVTSDLNDVKSSGSVDMTQRTPQRGDEGREPADVESVEPEKDTRCEIEIESESPRGQIPPSGNQEEDDTRDGTSASGLVKNGPPSPSKEQQPSWTRAEWLSSHNRIPVSRSSAIELRQHPSEPMPRMSRSTGHSIATSDLELAQCRLSGHEEVLRAKLSRSPPPTRSPLGNVSPIKSPRSEDTSEAEAHRVAPSVHGITIVRGVTKKPPTSSIFAFSGDSSCDRKHWAESDEIDAGAEQPPDIHSHDRDSRRDGDAGDTSASALTQPKDEPSSPFTPPEPRQIRSLPACGLAPVSLQPSSFPMMDSSQEVVKKSARDRVRSKLGSKVWWELEYTVRQLELEAAQSQGQKESSSDRLRGSGLLCDGKAGAKVLTTKPSLQSTVTQEASTNRAQVAVASSNAAPPASVLEVIKEERSISTPSTCSSRRDSEFNHMMPLPRELGDIYAEKDAQNKRAHDSCHNQAASDVYVILGSRGATAQKQDSPNCVSTSRSVALAQVVRPKSCESGYKTQARASTSDTIRVSSTDTSPVSLCPANGGARFEESSSKPTDYPTGSCKPRPQPTLLVQTASETQTSASTKEGSPTTRASNPRGRTPLRHSSRSVPQELSSPIQTLYEQGGQIQLGQSDCDDGMREHNGNTHRYAKNSLADEEHNQATSQAQPARARSSWDPRSLHNESPVETPINTLVADHRLSNDTNLPFHVNGRVPIRIHPVNSPSKGPSNYPVTGRTSPDQDEPSSPLKEAALPLIETTREATISPASRLPRPPPAAATATFISFHDDKTVVSAGKKEAATRMNRLNELRQKKLDQLHKAREQALQHQHEKKQKQKQQDKKPTAFDSGESSSGGTNSNHHTHLQPRAKRATNRQQLQNAIEFTLLAGQSNERERLAVLEALAQSTVESFVVLLKSAKELKFRALYESRTESDEARRIYSVVSSAYAPLRLTPDVVAQFFKYSSAKKQFLAVDTRSFTVTTDACALVDHLVFKKTTKPRLL